MEKKKPIGKKSNLEYFQRNFRKSESMKSSKGMNCKHRAFRHASCWKYESRGIEKTRSKPQASPQWEQDMA